MSIRTFWLNLGWLVMLVLTVAVPLVLDAFGRLTYFTSLGFWGIPILYLWPVFNMLTAEGTGRRRRALRWAAGTIVVLGIVLDFLFGYPDIAVPGLQRACGLQSLSVVSAGRAWQRPGRGASVLCDGPGGDRARVRLC